MPGIWHWSRAKGPTQDPGGRCAWNDVSLDCQGVQEVGCMLLMFTVSTRMVVLC